jgi:large subunit ribosomal protein L4
VVDHFNLDAAKTKGFTGALARLGLEKGVLVVDDAANHNLELSSRNVKGCELVRRHELHPYHVLSHNQLLISEGALTRLQEALR